MPGPNQEPNDSEVSAGQPDFYRFDEGQRESIRRIISAAKSMLSRNAISRAGEGLPSRTDSFLHAKIAAMTPRVRLRPSSISFSIGGSPQEFAAKEGNYSLLLLLPLVPEQLDGFRPIPGVVIVGVWPVPAPFSSSSKFVLRLCFVTAKESNETTAIMRLENFKQTNQDLASSSKSAFGIPVDSRFLLVQRGPSRFWIFKT